MKSIKLFTLVILSAACFLGFKYLTSEYPSSLTLAGHQPGKYITTPGENPEGTWSSGINFPLSGRYYGAHTTYTRNDTTWLFLLGGDTTGGGHATRTSYKFNFSTNQWSQIAPMPIPLRTHTAAAAGDYVYTFGGLDSPTSNGVSNIYKYNINTNTWSNAGNLPLPLFLSQAATFNDSVIFIVGGVTATLDGFEDVEIPNTFRYSTNDEETEDYRPLPIAKADMGFIGLRASFIDNPNIYKAYIIGGYNTGTVPSADVIECTIDITDSANTTYTVHSNVIPGGGLARHTVTPLSDGTMLVSGGVRDNGFSAINNHYIFNPDNISFTQLPNSNFPICAHHSGVAFTGNQYKFMTSAGITAGPSLTAMSQVYSDSVSVGIINLGTELPDAFLLHQNYPNPFNPVTKIRFDVVNISEEVKLTVFDISGKEVVTLINQKLSPGSYEYTFDATEMPSSIYFYRLISGETSVTKKMTLLK